MVDGNCSKLSHLPASLIVFLFNVKYWQSLSLSASGERTGTGERRNADWADLLAGRLSAEGHGRTSACLSHSRFAAKCLDGSRASALTHTVGPRALTEVYLPPCLAPGVCVCVCGSPPPSPVARLKPKVHCTLT